MPPDPSLESDQYTIHRVNDGIWGLEARATGSALSNSGIVRLEEQTLLFDSSLSLRSARALRGIAERDAGRIPTLVVNSHWHLDHLLGNQVFEGAPIWATQRTIDDLRQRRAELEKELSAETLKKEIAELRGQLERATSAYARAQLEPALRLNETLLEESVELRIVPPTDAFEKVLFLGGEGDRRATLHSFGSGHTQSDSVLFLPDERVVFAGDLIVNGHHPNLLSGDPEHWLVVLDEIDRLRPEKIVPGHGAIGGAAPLAAMRDYLTTLIEMGRESTPPKLPPRFAGWEGPEQFVRNMEFLRSRAPSRA